MSIKNLIKKDDRFNKTYFATVVSHDDPLGRGRLQVLIEPIMKDIPFWVDSTLTSGSVKLTLIPDPGDLVRVNFKNGDIYSGQWKLEGSPNNTANINPKQYGLSDSKGNNVTLDREFNSINMNTVATNITAADTFVNGAFGTSVGATAMIPLPNGQVLIFVNGIFQGVS